MSTPVEEATQSEASNLEQKIAELEQRVVRLEQIAHSEHTIGTEAIDQLVKQVIHRIGNGLASLVQTPE